MLAITPESLEAMLLSTRTPARRFLAHVRAVVIDEVHAFAGDDRGAHLVALLERVTRISENDVQRIGLSATVGDPEVIVQWLSGSSLRPQRVVDPGGPRKPPELALDFVGTLRTPRCS
ncbi:MAG: DEAD/DEAH box helicase [Myxococcales bacterium]|nr:DEAD/DEAH box helicase [Myxococcales bacterium]